MNDLAMWVVQCIVDALISLWMISTMMEERGK